MCGIVGAVAERNITPILLEGLKRLEYRGYDSAGVAVIDGNGELNRRRAVGKVAMLEQQLVDFPLAGHQGIAHTRWATHGAPTEPNAHPHTSRSRLAVVHNGIIENYIEIREELIAEGYQFESETDSEVVAHLIDYHFEREGNLVRAVQKAVPRLTGAYSLGVMSLKDPDHVVGARFGSPLVIGIGIGEHFLASDVFALGPVTNTFVYLEEGDVAEISRESYRVFDASGTPVTRKINKAGNSGDIAGKGEYRHYMLKEIFEQPSVLAETLEGRLHQGKVLESSFGPAATALFDQVQNVHIVACGTSYHAGLTARYWMESLGVPCQVEVASEYRYRDGVIPTNTLFVSISQSGETADTLAALKEAKRRGCLGSLAICNVPESSLVRESDLTIMTRAGREIGVASTKAFTTQLAVLQMLTLVLARRRGLSPDVEARWVEALGQAPRRVEEALALNGKVQALAERFADKHHALFLGRGSHYPVAMEGALKLKEISYIHAEAYPAGELKHGPLALVDADMPVVCVLPNDVLLEKLLSNLQEVQARGGELFLFADDRVSVPLSETTHILKLDSMADTISPIVFTVPLQLLSYHVAVLKGTDVDQPRNLAKSVTVE